MIKYYLSNNNKTYYSNFSSTFRELNGASLRGAKNCCDLLLRWHRWAASARQLCCVPRPKSPKAPAAFTSRRRADRAGQDRPWITPSAAAGASRWHERVVSFMPPALNVLLMDAWSAFKRRGLCSESDRQYCTSGFALLVCYCTAALIAQITRPGFPFN